MGFRALPRVGADLPQAGDNIEQDDASQRGPVPAHGGRGVWDWLNHDPATCADCIGANRQDEVDARPAGQ
eukprot:10633809-Karenia_brevis.AAC.1